MDALDLLLHPVRVRIVHAMAGGRTLTTSDLCARLPDVPKTTMYRHVGLLAKEGVLEVEGEQRVHGAVERRYRLRRERAVIDREHADPFADSVGYAQVPLWLSQDELAELIGQVRDALLAQRENEPAPDRGLYLASPILFPIADPPPRGTSPRS